MEKKHLAVLAGVPLALSGCLKDQGAPVDYRGNITYGREANYDEKGNELPKYSAENPAKLDAKIADKYVEKKEEYSVAAEVPAVVEESPSLTNLKTSSMALTHAAAAEDDAKNTVVADKTAPKSGFFDKFSSSASSLFGGSDDDKDLAQKPAEKVAAANISVAKADAKSGVSAQSERVQDAAARASALPSGVTIAAAPKKYNELITKIDPTTNEIEFVAPNDTAVASSDDTKAKTDATDKKDNGASSASGSFFSSLFKHDAKKEESKPAQVVKADESKDKPVVVASSVSVPAPATVITLGADKADKKEASKAETPKQEVAKDAKTESASGSFFSSLFKHDAKKDESKSAQVAKADESKDKPVVVASAVSVPAPATVITLGADKADKKEPAKAETPKHDASKDVKAEAKSGSFFSSLFKKDDARDKAKNVASVEPVSSAQKSDEKAVSKAGLSPAEETLHKNQLATAKPEPKKDVHVVKITKDDVLLSDKSDTVKNEKKDVKSEAVASDEELKKAQELVAHEMANVEAQKASQQGTSSYTKSELASAGQRSVEQSVAAPVTAVTTDNAVASKPKPQIAVRMPVNKNIVLDNPSSAKSVIRLQDMSDAQTAQVADASAAPSPVALQEPQAAQSQGQVSFLWPVKGKVVTPFGKTLENGRESDGINIAAKEGEAVAAAADGVVVYADSRLKGYGNMVVIQHEGGWLSAYAHASALQVQKGERVRAGQSIATVGATGNVPSPQLYFALRKNKQSYDPLTLIGKGA